MSSLVINRPRLSKSTYLTGKQCHLRLWHDFHARHLATPTDAALQLVFDTGHEVGELACRRYPGGHLITSMCRRRWRRRGGSSMRTRHRRFLRPRLSMSMSWSAPMCSIACLTVIGEAVDFSPAPLDAQIDARQFHLGGQVDAGALDHGECVLGCWSGMRPGGPCAAECGRRLALEAPFYDGTKKTSNLCQFNFQARC